MLEYLQVPHPTKTLFGVSPTEGKGKKKRAVKYFTTLLYLLRIEPMTYGLHHHFNYKGKRGAKWRLEQSVGI